MNPWQDIFGEVPPSFEDRVQTALRGLEEDTMQNQNGKNGRTRKHPARMGALIALAAVLLMGSAVAVTARIQLTAERQMVVYESSGTTREELVLGFEATDDDPIYLGVWELTGVPDGYERTNTSYMLVDNGAEGGETWENDAGGSIGFQYQAANQAFGQIALDTADIQAQENVTVSGCPGILYVMTDGRQLLRWGNEERGIGFILTTPEDVDILALAGGVQESSAEPEISEETAAAIAQLGDWIAADAPDGYTLYFSYGYSGDFAYVYRTYKNAENYQIHLDYEAAVYSDDIEAVVAYYRQLAEMAEEYGNSKEDGIEKYTVTELTVQGMDARLVECEDGTPLMLAWMDNDHKLVFTMSADNLTAEELIDIANSVTLSD